MTSETITPLSRPDYGLDAPYVVWTLAIGGAVTTGLAVASYFLFHEAYPWLAGALAWPGISWLLTAIVMFWGSRHGKLRVRDRLLDRLEWRGDERVLDVGCGHGLLLIGAAKRLTSGKAVGIDIWRNYDQANNSAEATRRNVEIEGVSDRVEIRDADARNMPFPDGSFDIIVSSWALHNIPTSAGRTQALREIIRVLRPGGQLAILDIWGTSKHVALLEESGFVDVQRRVGTFAFLWPTFLVLARKPA
jgi:SAM-dependent methyltransferase